MAKMNLGALTDALYTARAERIKVQHDQEEELSKLKAEETDLRQKIIHEMKKLGLDRATGTEATASITKAIYPRVTDWTAAHAWMIKHKRLDLLERRIAKAAYREMYEAKEFVPGIEAFEEEDLSLVKASR